jgi:serine/threonine-protein kinase
MKSDTHLASLSNPTLIPKGRIGRFVYESEIGHGSVGIVYLFRDPLIGRKVAIKVLNPQLPAGQRQLFEKHFIQEARAAGRLNHPNIVTVYDADKSGDLLFIVMEYLEGKELSDILKSGHQFSYRQIADLIARIARALDYAHEHGVIHRDIKPANIFIHDNGTPKVLDFGIASASRQIADADTTLEDDYLPERRLLGTPNYMSPEQSKSETVDTRTDIFSLGVVLYQLLCGQLPFKGKDIPGLLHAIAHDPAIPPHEIRADVPLRLARIAARALAKKPADRYQRASDMAHDLNRYLEKERAGRLMAKISPPDPGKTPQPNNSVFAKKRHASMTAAEQNLRRFAPVSIAALVAAGGLWLTFSPPQNAVAPQPASMANLNTKEFDASVINVTSMAASASFAAANLELAAAPPGSASAPEESAEIAPDRTAATEKKTANALKVSKSKLTASAMKAESGPVKMGIVSIAVSPWGEVFVDGISKGVTPPLTRLNLPVGKHKIDIRNGDDTHATTIEVSNEKEVRLTHRF